MRTTLFNLVAGALLATAAMSANATEYRDSDGDPSAGAMAFDLLIGRPLGLAATVLGTGLFVLQLPLTITQGTPPEVPAQKLVVEPAKWTFSRPLGASE